MINNPKHCVNMEQSGISEVAIDFEISNSNIEREINGDGSVT